MKITSTFFQSCLIEPTQNGQLLKVLPLVAKLQPPLAVCTPPPQQPGGWGWALPGPCQPWERLVF